jgi:hypothetical protein
MHICAEHRDVTPEKKEAEAAAAAAAAGGAAIPGAAVPGVANPAGGAAAAAGPAADIYSAGAAAAPAAPSASADNCHLGGSAEQAVAAIGLVAAVLGEEVGGEMARRLLDGMLQVCILMTFTPFAPIFFAFINDERMCHSPAYTRIC